MQEIGEHRYKLRTDETERRENGMYWYELEGMICTRGMYRYIYGFMYVGNFMNNDRVS